MNKKLSSRRVSLKIDGSIFEVTLRRHRLLIIFIILFSGIISSISYSQDSTKKKIDTLGNPLNFIVSENKYSYLNQVNPDTITRKRFLWHPLKSFDDIFSFLPGYYLRSKDIGQINQLTFNQLNENNTGVLRNGRPINDMIDGSIDLNLLSRNEIAEIELSNGYGNSSYNYLNTVNIIQRQQFQYRPYTELAFWLDRYGNEYIDANFSQNFFKGFNFNFGVTKNSADHKYVNSDFDKWLGRFNFNYAPSKSLNFFLYTNYSKIQRGLNEGIKADSVDITNKEIMFNPTLAVVNNSDAYEIKERFDIDGGALFQKGISYTKLQLYVSNSFRKYRDEENRPNPNGITIKFNRHWINYGVKLQEILNFKLLKKLKIVSRSEVEYNYLISMFDYEQPAFVLQSSSHNLITSKLTLFENLEVSLGNFSLGGYIRDENRLYTNHIYAYLRAGVEGSYILKLDSLNAFNFSAMYNSADDYYSAGIAYKHGLNKISLSYYSYTINTYNSNGSYYDMYNINGINSDCVIRLFNFDLDIAYNYNFNNETYSNHIFPLHSGNISLAYHNTGFKNKFEYKIGLTSRFWSEYYSVKYSGISNSFVSRPTVRIPSNATLDFFIVGKIGKATFGLTFENILDRLIYNMGVYPAIDRGGLFNVWSRFNITWNFLD